MHRIVSLVSVAFCAVLMACGGSTSPTSPGGGPPDPEPPQPVEPPAPPEPTEAPDPVPAPDCDATAGALPDGRYRYVLSAQATSLYPQRPAAGTPQVEVFPPYYADQMHGLPRTIAHFTKLSLTRDGLGTDATACISDGQAVITLTGDGDLKGFHPRSPRPGPRRVRSGPGPCPTGVRHRVGLLTELRS